MKVAIVYTMEGCPFCQMIKEELEKNNLPFITLLHVRVYLE